MDGSVNPSEVATLSLLGGAGGIGYGRGQYANTATIQHGLGYNAQKTEDMADSNREIFKQTLNGVSSNLEGLQRDNQFSATTLNVNNGFARVCDAIRANEQRNSDQIFQQELRNGDRLRDQDKTIEANARAAAECCCALKLQACTDKSEILAAIAASSAKTTERELDKANAEIIYLRSKEHHHRG